MLQPQEHTKMTMILSNSKTLVTVRAGTEGPVLFVWVDGKEVAQYQMDERSMLWLVEELISKYRESV